MQDQILHKKISQKCILTFFLFWLDLAASRHFVFFAKKKLSQKLFKLQKPNFAGMFIE
jgi:hypothetical protein